MSTKFTALFIAMALVAPSIGDAGQAVGTAKARGDYSSSQSQRSATRSVARSRPAYRYSAPVVREAPSAAIAQAPAEGRRYSQAPASADSAVSSARPCPDTPSIASQPSSERRYSYAPAPQYSVGPRYSGNVGRGSQPAWALPKTAPGKYSTR